MRALFDVVHPAHVHFFKHVIAALSALGHDTEIVARDKDVTTQLLDALDYRYLTVGRAGRKGWLGQARELLERDWALLRVARAFRPTVILTRSPGGAQVGRLLGIPCVFDTDDGRAAGVHFWASAPFAHVITTPDCFTEDYGRRHVTYPGYKQTAYLHPNHFTPDPTVLRELGVEPGERFFIVRFVAMNASHDVNEQGLSLDAKREIVRRLSAAGRVFLSFEGSLPDDLTPLRMPLSPERLHDALAFADLLVGDSQTMAAEAAVLGTPSLRISSWAGRVPHLEEIEQRYHLTAGYLPTAVPAVLAHLDRWLAEPRLRESNAANHRKLLDDKVDVAAWFTNFLLAGCPVPTMPMQGRQHRQANT